MKHLLIGLLVLLAAINIASAGESTFSATTPAPSSSWFADREFNLQLWGTYSLTGNDYARDRYLGVDHAWGGGLDAKYFLNRYVGLGAEGYLLSADRDVRYFSFFAGMSSTPVAHANQTIGAGLGTLTLRYPIGVSRFAPYVFAGGGVIAGGGRQLGFEAVNLVGAPPGTNPLRAHFSDGDTQAVGQFGGGLEIRVTSHFGVMSDFSWDVINGADNNFGMVRSGLNFAF